jgi:hypothetical protein
MFPSPSFIRDEKFGSIVSGKASGLQELLHQCVKFVKELLIFLVLARQPRRRRSRSNGNLSLVEQFPQIDWSTAIEAAARDERRRAAAAG